MLLFSLLLALASIFQCDASDIIGCESSTLDLYCTNGKAIRVLSANYGRTSIFPCFIYFGADNCKAANSTQIVSHRCNNQQKCSIDVSNSLFGDPCELVPKYLEVNYTCDTIQEEDQVLVTCQDQTMVLVCPDGLTLEILEADYGRGCYDLCPSPGLRTDLNCSASNSTEILRENCDGFNTCILNVTDDVFGDPCSGVAKYLKVNYTCLSPTTPSVTTPTSEPTYPTICEDDELTINCAAGSLINITYAFYGRASSTICQNLLSLPFQNCSSPNATQTVSHLCDNLPSCTITASNNVFGGDPCFLGTRKYLQVDWTCKTESSTACQDSDLTINCPNGTSINVGAAVFGRNEEDICPGGIVPLPQDQNCTSRNATDISIASCDHLQSCTLNANISVFGDPCPGTRKYLQVNYTCPFTNNTGPIKDGTVCQGQTLYMSCPGQVINVINALFGRLTDSICRPLLALGSKCQASGATNKVRQLCENKESCNVSASVFVFGDPCILISKYLQVNYTCVNPPPPPPPSDNVTIECEGSLAEIRCPARDVINIVYANYGRTSLLTCPSILGLTKNCISPNATQVVRNRCENLNSCAIGANNGVFGDPCNGIKKYLEIVYTCQPLNPSTVRACQNATLTITCPIGTTIDVVSAKFGRTSNKYCSTSSTPVTNCTTSNATSIVQERCDDLQYCTIQANNSLFGNPCGGIPNYLEVSYACFKGTPMPSTSEEYSSVDINVCDNTTRSIYCPRGEINIVYANYGRTSPNTCTNSPEHVSNCQSRNATEIVRKSCENLKICTITANSSIYGDPCIGVSKYLEVIYFCEEISTTQKSVCENETLNLSCPSGKAIDIVHVEYGRSSNTICPIANYSSNENCISNNASDIVINSCDDKQNCSVIANNEVFGNVCPTISKYLQVIYKCLNSKISSTSTSEVTTTSPWVFHNLCENLYINLDCFNGDVINIVYANWGRTSANVCTGNNSQITNCIQSNTTEIVRKSCENKESCSLSASSEVYGDPCIDVSKYLEVVYFCTELKPNTSTVCENGTLNLSCPHDTKLDIVSAVYGRFNNDVCPVEGGRNVTNCSSDNATAIIDDRCDDKQECSVVVNSELFGDPCSQVAKYLQVSYMCLYSSTPTTVTSTGLTNGTTPTGPTTGPKPTTPTEPVVYLCENLYINLDCFNGDVLNIVYANWGRTSANECKGNNSQITNCIQPNTTEIVRKSCENKESCTLSASSEVYGDPCIDVSKYLEVVYFCTELKPNTSTVCENGTLNLSCPHDTKLDIVSAVYGRFNNDVCPVEGGRNVTNCSSENATTIIDDRCDDKQECSVVVNSELFGDPCSQVAKYLQVSYMCLYSSTPTTVTSTGLTNGTTPTGPTTGPKPTTPTEPVVYLCENLYINLDCFNGDVLNIVYANWGRTSANECKGNNSQITNCIQPNTTEIVRKSCENKESCTLSASSEVYGDPCIDVSKYLEVVYFCTELKPNTSTVCENGTLNLSCPHDTKLDIVSAVYGRFNNDVCPVEGGRNVTNCSSENATTIIDDRCDDKQECSVVVNSELFGDPCSQVAKYLQVSYMCLYSSTPTTVTSTGLTNGTTPTGPTTGPKPTTPTEPVVYLCENLYINLDCFNGDVLNIVYANWGRTSANECKGNNSQITNCIQPNTTEIVRKSCENKESCTLSASSEVYGDPCIDVSKYLEVVYFCTELKPNTSTVCENGTLNLSCPHDTKLDIVSAVYGRFNNDVCPVEGGRNVTNCSSENATTIIDDRCDDKQECSVVVNSELFGDPCSQVAKYLQVSYMCLYSSTPTTVTSTGLTNGTTPTGPTTGPKPTTPTEPVVYLCENLYINLDCFNGDVLNIVYANWGRTSANECKGNNSQITNCIQPNTTEIVRKSCENKESCTLSASSEVYGDPCIDVSKYLEVVYFCTELKPNTSTVCENGTLNLSCPHDTKLDIVSAVYGRFNNDVCPVEGGRNVTNCSSENATTIIDDRCDDKQECSVVVNSELFGDPCSQVAKYLQVSYMCLYSSIPTTVTPTGSTTGKPTGQTQTTPTEHDVYLCENLDINLNCFDGDVINIVYANWGRTSASECKGNNSQITNCIQPNTTEIVRKSCENKESCSLSASSEVYGDPCIDVSKYLEVVYFCTELKPNTSTVCENGTLNLSCPHDTKLDIVNAVYGRFNNDVCPVEGGRNVTNCSSENATAIIDDRCDDKQECSVVVSSKLFGDPCSQVAKYLQVSYMCLYSVYPTPPTGPVDIILNATSCQGAVLLLSCPDDDFIFIYEANYGSTDLDVCPLAHNSPNSTCTSNSTATSILSDNCDGLNSCVSNISSEIFENPCIGAYKSLVVFYICAKRDTNQTSLNETACENTELNLSCANGEDLNIIKANYGRSSSSVCPRIGQDQNTNCTLQNSTLIVSESCDGQSSCSINATNSIFGDACPGTYKYLEVEYSCPGRLEVIPSKGTACQGSTLKLTCPVGQHLDILLAIYGRLSATTCPTNSLNENTNCTSFNATSLLSSRCNNAETCSINATSSEFGDPCPNTNKYLEVYYRCSATLQCGLNEKIGCASSCTNRMCGISSNDSLCLSKICAQGCVCQNDYVRDPNNGLCIAEKYCPLPGRPCQTHEVFTRCGAGCQASCVEAHPICTDQCISGYVCKEGFIRDTSTGRCVRSEDCPCS